jgi:hypothetical protein
MKKPNIRLISGLNLEGFRKRVSCSTYQYNDAKNGVLGICMYSCDWISYAGKTKEDLNKIGGN